MIDEFWLSPGVQGSAKPLQAVLKQLQTAYLFLPDCYDSTQTMAALLQPTGQILDTLLILHDFGAYTLGRVGDLSWAMVLWRFSDQTGKDYMDWCFRGV